MKKFTHYELNLPIIPKIGDIYIDKKGLHRFKIIDICTPKAEPPYLLVREIDQAGSYLVGIDKHGLKKEMPVMITLIWKGEQLDIHSAYIKA